MPNLAGNKKGTINEIKFDPRARAEYLTGFHKRKRERIRRAQEQAAKREREEKIQRRKESRERRKQEFEQYRKTLSAGSEKASARLHRSDDDSELQQHHVYEDGPGCWWSESDDRGVLKNETDLDDDGLITVSVRAMDVAKRGLTANGDVQPNGFTSSAIIGTDNVFAAGGTFGSGKAESIGGSLSTRRTQRQKKRMSSNHHGTASLNI